VLILVLLLVSFITVMYHVGYPFSLPHLCFTVFLPLYVCIDVLICSDVQLQEYLINLLTYLLTYLLTCLRSRCLLPQILLSVLILALCYSFSPYVFFFL